MEELLRNVISGDETAWQKLLATIEPFLMALTGKWHIAGRMSKDEDDRRTVVVETIARLRSKNWHRVRLFLASPEQREGSFERWLAAVLTTTSIDCMRLHPHYIAPRGRTEASETPGPHWARHKPASDSTLGADCADATRLVLATQVLERAPHVLKADALEAVQLWRVGFDYQEIAERLGLPDAHAAENKVNLALRRLREHFREEEK